MNIETAIKKLKEEYEKTEHLEYVNNPVAYALYQVWREADREKEVWHEAD